MNAEIVAVGTELLLGQIVDTNSAWMARRLADLGVNLFYKTVVGDNFGRMREVLSRALERSDLVITSGGLGPTRDDLTREVVAEVTGRRLVLHPDLLRQIEERFRRRGLVLTENNRKQAFIPEGAIPLENPNGTAPAFIVEDPRGVVVSLPGVPFELKWLFDNRVVPYIKERFGLRETIFYRVLKVAELGESRVDDRIGHLIAGSSNPTVGVLAHPGQVDVRITAKAGSREEALRLIEPVEREIRSLLGHHVFAVDEETMEDAVGRLLDHRGLTVASYEDLTGGMVAERLQRASRERFAEGIINNSATSVSHLLRLAGAEETPEDPSRLTDLLARAVRARSGTDLGLAVHVMPQDEGVENLSRGRTFISVTDGERLARREYSIAGRGTPDRTRLSLNALNLLREFLLGLAAEP